MAEIEYTVEDTPDGGLLHELKITEEFKVGDRDSGVYPGGVPVEGGEGWLVHWATSPELAGHIVCNGPNGCGVVESRPPTMHYDPDDPSFDDETYWEQYDRAGIPPSEYARRLIREHAVRVHGALVFGGPDLDGGGAE